MNLIHSPVFETGGELFTSSLEIAEGTYVQHASVVELITNHLNDFSEFGQVRFETRPRLPGQHGGGATEFAVLNESQATLLLTYMRNSDIVRAFKKRLVKAFYEMRFDRTKTAEDVAMRTLGDPAALRGLLGNYVDRVIALEATVAAQAPKVAVMEAIAAAPDLFCMRDAAKHLGWNPNVLVTWLATERWIFYNQSGKRWVAYQPPIENGFLCHKFVKISENADGTPKTVPQVMVTSKGIVRIRKVFEKRRAAMAEATHLETCH